MARRPSQFTTIRSEGGLLPSDLLARVARLDSTLPGLQPGAYWLDPGDRIAEAITRSWNRLLGAWETFSRHRVDAKPDDPIVGLTRDRWLYPLLDELGWGRPVRGEETSNERGNVPIHLLGANVPIDRRTPNVPGAAKHSPHTVVQDLLNRREDMLWGLVSNGAILRLLRDNTTMTRQAFVEFDLEAIFEGEVYADFVVLWLSAHCSRFDAERPDECLAERWANEAQSSGVRALAQLRTGVEDALVHLGNGFLVHRANTTLHERLTSRELVTYDYYRQLLRLVYRLIFLFCAEDRGSLQDPAASSFAKETYASHYSMSRLRHASRRRGTEHSDQWNALRIVMRGLKDGCAPLGLPPLGSMLWSEHAIPDLDGASLANRHLSAAIRSLAHTIDGRTLRAVDWRNLGSEELGSVYESLLELHPDISDGVSFALGTAAGHERKVTGSYYTPTSLITELLDSALDPVLDEAKTPDDILALKVCDPACGSGHFLIAAAHRIARRLAMARTGEPEPAPDAVRAALRDVIGHCLYGVDVNEMAVELCKVSLWLEALEPGKPLSFLDHRIACGNSLLGATPRLMDNGIPDEAYKPITGDVKEVASAWRKRNATENKGQATFGFGSTEDATAWLAGELTALEGVDDSTPEGVREKEERWAALQGSRQAAAAKLAADAWCAAFVMPKTKSAPVVTTGALRQIQSDPDRTDTVTREAVNGAAGLHRFLHWHLVFPDVFAVPADGAIADNAEAGWSGGFDVVCGNPPWERVKLSEKEFFAVRHPEIAALAGAKRKKAIQELADDDPDLYADYLAELRRADGESTMLRGSGRYPLCGRGDVNTYAVFAEGMRNLVGPAGRCGVIVPSGIATDDTTKFFFRDVVERGSLVSLFDFENAAPSFPSVHRSFKFCLLTLAGPARPPDAAAEFVFFAHQTADLSDPERRFTLSADDLALLNPNTRTCPVFRSRRDAELTKAIYRRVPVLIEQGPPERNPWSVVLTTLFHMTNDSNLLRTAADLEALGAKLGGNVYRQGDRTWVPLYEGRLGHQFNHRFASQSGGDLVETAREALKDPSHLTVPQFWMNAADAEERLGRRTVGCTSALLGFRRVARNTDERTVISALLPWGAASYGWILSLGPDATSLAVLAATYNSFVFDYLMRSALSQPSVPQSTFEQLPVPPPETFSDEESWTGGSPLSSWLAARVLELSYTSVDLEPFARSLGCDDRPFRWDDSRRSELRAEIDACFFHLYGLSREEVEYVMDAFPIACRKDEAAHGEYRTKRLILEQFDEMSGMRSALKQSVRNTVN